MQWKQREKQRKGSEMLRDGYAVIMAQRTPPLLPESRGAQKEARKSPMMPTYATKPSYNTSVEVRQAVNRNSRVRLHLPPSVATVRIHNNRREHESGISEPTVTHLPQSPSFAFQVVQAA